MAQKRDFLDDLIDIQTDWKAIQNPLGSLANSLTGEPADEPTWNPADWKERPRANTIPCTSCKTKDDSFCTRCQDVCPTDAIEFDEGAIELADTCRKCGLCTAVCPSECFSTQKTSARKLYQRICTAATSHEEAYVTCTRALGRIPEENEVVLPCIGDVPVEVWFAVLVEYPNVSVYLPLDICTRCRTTTGEARLTDAISQAETWAGKPMNLEVDDSALNHEIRRSWQRKEFVNSALKTGANLVGGVSRPASALQAVTAKLDLHSKQIIALQQSLDRMCGERTTQSKRRILTARRQIMLSALQKAPELAPNIKPTRPVADTSVCTLCGACEDVCPVHALDLTEDGHVRIEAAYCTECGACVDACSAHALAMEAFDAQELVVVPDEPTEEEIRKKTERAAQAELLKQKSKEKLDKGLDMLEKLDDGSADK